MSSPANCAPPDPPSSDLVVWNADTKSIDIATPVGGHVLKFVQGARTLTADQLQLLAPLGIEAGWDPGQVLVYLMDCQRRGFDPWAKETYLMKYPGDKYISHIGIAGFRTKAEESREYKGVEGPLFSGDGVTWSEVWSEDDAVPRFVKAGIRRRKFGTQWARISYLEFAPMRDKWVEGRKVGREFTPMWLPASQGGKPMVMSGKCAQAAAFRMTFPRRFDNFYEPAETEKLREDAHAESPAASRRRAAFAKAAQPAAPVQGPTDVIDGEVIPAGDPAPSALPVDPWAQWGSEAAARDALERELVEQATIMGRELDVFTARRAAANGGRSYDMWTAAELLEFVTTTRPYVERQKADMLRGPQDTS